MVRQAHHERLNLTALDEIEDASIDSQSKHCGSFGKLGVLSFNGNKIITTGGGGMIVTDRPEWAERSRYLTTQAKEDGVEYVHNSVGYNYRMNNVLAAIGLAQLENLDERIAIKRDNFARYEEALGPSRLLGQPAWSESNRWFYALLCDSADMKRELLAACTAAGIQVRPLWYPNHLQKPYREMQAHRITRAPDFYDTVLNLPCSLSLTPEQIAEVTALVEAAAPGRHATPA